jgi:hypothetical protein
VSDKKVQVWFCKIIVPAGELPNGFDGPPRKAATEAIEAAGVEVLGCSSGWGGSLTKGEAAAFADNTGDIYYAGTMDERNETAH